MSHRLRWLSILLPVALVGAIELISDSLLDEALPFPRDTLLVVGVVATITAVFGTLAWRAIDRLTATLQARNRELETRGASARALHQVSMAIAALADLEAILLVIVDSARGLLATDLALLVLTRPDGRPYLAASSGPTDAFRPAGDGIGDDVAAFVQPGALVAVVAAPLQRGGATIGTLAVGGRVPRAFTIDEVETLSSLANQAAIAIENSRLHDQLREVAVRGERERIARELHDGLAQVLGYVNTKSQAVEELLSVGRTDEARAHLGQLATAARSIYVDVREAILGLSSPVVAERGLAGALEGYVARWAEAAKIAARVRASPDAVSVPLPPDIEAQAFRIVQEALTNVRKHAAARRVEIDLDVLDGQLVVRVQDDGRGLAAGESPGEAWPRYGVVAMRDRAAAIGGSVDWTTMPGPGTCVRLVVPLPGASTNAATPLEAVR